MESRKVIFNELVSEMNFIEFFRKSIENSIKNTAKHKGYVKALGGSKSE